MMSDDWWKYVHAYGAYENEKEASERVKFYK